jgi:hypothetical protein
MFEAWSWRLHLSLQQTVLTQFGRASIRHLPIETEIRVGHGVERECCFDPPTPLHAEFIGKLTIVEESQHTIGQQVSVVARHKKSRLAFQN